MSSDKSKKIGAITEQLNKALGKALETFALNTEWSDIPNWLANVQSLLRDFPSPYIADKILLSKRLNQCMNHILPEKVHQSVIRIHQLLFRNMKLSVEGNINDYIKLFAEDLGVYSLSLLPHFVHTNNFEQRLSILKIINSFYMDLGKELIPMLPGLLKALLSVYSATINPQLMNLIEVTLEKLLNSVGRRFVVGCTWSLILKYRDCKKAGLLFLSRVIEKMEFIKGEEQLQEQRGFSDIQSELLEESDIHDEHGDGRGSGEKVLTHLNSQEQKPIFEQDSNTIPLASPNDMVSPIKELLNEPEPFSASQEQLGGNKGILENIMQEALEESINDKNSRVNRENEGEEIKKTENNEEKQDEKEKEKGRVLFQSQGPFVQLQILRDSNEISLNAVPLMLSPGLQKIREGIDDPSLPENNFPRVGSLVVNALISSLAEDEPQIRRTALNFMFSHLRIKSDYLGENEKDVLVEALLRLFKKKEISITSRVNRWLFGKEDQENRYLITEKNQFVIPYIVRAFQRILSTIPTNEDNCTVPLKILQNFYIEHEHLVEGTLSQISTHLLRYIFNFGCPSDQAGGKRTVFYQQVLKVGKRFLQNLPSYYVVILQSLGECFVEKISEEKEEEAFEVVKYIDFCYIKLMKHDHSYEELEYITVILKYLTQGMALVAAETQQTHQLNKLFLKDTVLLIYNLVERRRAVLKINNREQEIINEKYMIESGARELPPERVNYQRELKERESCEELKYIGICAKLEQFFIELGYIVRNFTSIHIYEESFKLCAMSMVGLQLYLPHKGCQALPKWFNTLEGAIKVSNPLVSLAAIEAMIRCLMWEDRHPIYSSFKGIIVQERAHRKGTDYQRVALEKLWSLLDFPHMHSKIIDLIVTFSRHFPNEFTQTVKRSFNTNSAPDKEASIQRFSHFWRLTAFKYKDLLSYKEFAELNKVGLFRMLDFLDDQNPLVRHAAKTWLVESMPLLKRVMEPLLLELIAGCAEWYQTPKGLLLIQRVYDTNLIFSTFRRIRSILANGSYSFLRFIYQTQITQSLDQMRQKITTISSSLFSIHEKDDQPVEVSRAPERQPVLPRALQSVQIKEVKGAKMSYMDLLVILAVKYIEGHAVESMGVEFYLGNAGVNASAVELVQTLLDYIDNAVLCGKVLDYVMDFLFKVLRQVVGNSEYIMQIQILNLLRNIFFNSSFRKKAQLSEVRSFFRIVFTNKTFLWATLQGLNTPFAYVRNQFISFITLSIPLMADFLEPEECTECIRHILFTYYRIIKGIGKALPKNVVEQQEEDSREVSLVKSRIQELERRIRQEERLVKFRDNLKQVGKTNQILSVLHGVQAVLNYFYDLDKINPKELDFQFENPYNLLDTLKKVLTLGLASSSKHPKLVERKNFLHNFETCQALLKDLQPVYETILRSWPLSEEFVRIGSEEFSNIGMRSFNFERFSRYNKVVKDLISYVEEEKESIWGKIYCIIQPMFCRFPTDIIDIYLKLWIRQCENSSLNESSQFRPDPSCTELLMKIMETIIVNNFRSDIVIHAFLESTAMTELTHYYSSKKTDKRGAILDFQIDKSESKLLYFIYVYFNYVYLNEKELTYQPLLEVWSLIMKVLAPFRQSRSPLSAIWIIEILNLGAKKYSPKQLLKNQTFKKDLHGLINQKLKYLAGIASRKQIFFFEEPLAKVNFEEDQLNTNKYHIVTPLPPTIYDILKSKPLDRNRTDELTLKTYRPGETSEIQTKYRVYCFKILKRLGLQILQNTYLPEKTHWVVVRTCQWIDLVLPVIEDKSSFNQTYAECASEVVFDLLERARLLFIKELKPRVLSIFNKDDFFICNTNTLKYWAQIIDWVVSLDKHNETYHHYLEKVTLSSSYFSSESAENKRRIKSFERICFILYSGTQDRYAQKLTVLLGKIIEVIKKPETAHAALLILILFALRILILRLSEITLNQLFIDIWPMILTLLMQTFTKQPVRVHIRNQISKNPNYLLAALKLIEMISLTNLGQFAHHQWIFLTDYFGVRLTVPESTVEMRELLTKRPELKSIINISSATQTLPFIYRPCMLNYLPQCSIDYSSKKEEVEGESSTQFEPKKRLIVVKDSFVRDESELRMNGLVLMQYLVSLNQERCRVDWGEVEEVIVSDFINLDSFIHQIS